MTTHDMNRHPYGIDRLEEWRMQGRLDPCDGMEMEKRDTGLVSCP